MLPDPSLNPAWYGEIWTRYPLSQSLSPTYYGYYLKAISDFRVILGELCHASFGKRPKLAAQQAIVFICQLKDWFDSLPRVLKPMNIVLPAHFLMQ
jgi:hypothetical protein